MYEQNPNTFLVQYKHQLTLVLHLRNVWSIERECKKHQWSCTGGFSVMQRTLLQCIALYCIVISLEVHFTK